MERTAEQFNCTFQVSVYANTTYEETWLW